MVIPLVSILAAGRGRGHLSIPCVSAVTFAFPFTFFYFSFFCPSTFLWVITKWPTKNDIDKQEIKKPQKTSGLALVNILFVALKIWGFFLPRKKLMFLAYRISNPSVVHLSAGSSICTLSVSTFGQCCRLLSIISDLEYASDGASMILAFRGSLTIHIRVICLLVSHRHIMGKMLSGR